MTKITKQDSRLGRIIVPDERDTGFPMSSVIRKEPGRTYRYWWPSGWWGDQGWTPQCVSYAWLHFVEDGPITHPETKGSEVVMDPTQLYNEAQLVDAWEGEDYDGTSVRAGAKRLQHHGFINSYWWAWDVDTVVEALLSSSPVVVGSWWHENMFYPNADGKITTGGGKSGGHAYLLNGVNVERGIIRIKNSWGRAWGKNGYAYMSIDDMGTLIDDYGEACVASQIKPEEV